MQLAADADAVLLLELGVGDFIYPGSTVLRIDERGGKLNDDRLRELVLVDRERTFEQDPAFGFRLLVDMASAALSPAVNDPTTAVQVLDELAELLRMLSDRRLRGSISDREGTPRLYYLAPSWEDYVGLACDEIRHYGADQPQIARRMKAMLDSLAEIAPPDRQAPIGEQQQLLRARVIQTYPDPAERARAEIADPQGIGISRMTTVGDREETAEPGRRTFAHRLRLWLRRTFTRGGKVPRS